MLSVVVEKPHPDGLLQSRDSLPFPYATSGCQSRRCWHITTSKTWYTRCVGDVARMARVIRAARASARA